jgi:group II intron reverse transcriptase/maturase
MDPAEGRGRRFKEPLEGNMAGAQKPEYISALQQRIAKLAEEKPEMGFTSLAHLIDICWLQNAHYRTRKDGAVGVDGQTSEDYEANLQANLQSLLDRAKSGTYFAPPGRRVHIPKAGSATETRPLGIPTFEDKVLQRAVTMVLETIYEQDFLDCSYGFRPGRSAHQALQALWQQTMKMGGGWIVEVDIRKFFDTIDHSHLRAFLKQRMCDGVLLRLIGKWLNAGVLEDGCITHPETGSPQGGVISPLLANIFLHYVLDDWFVREVQPRLKGRSFLIRFADDFVMGFTYEEDARRVMDVLPTRFEKYGLTLHPEKTRLVPFERPTDRPQRPGTQERTPAGTFDLLGFTHYWGRSRSGTWVVKRQTSKSRFSRKLTELAQWLRKERHSAVSDQHRTLSQKLRGHFSYYGITGNAAALQRFRRAAIGLWRKWLGRRHNGGEIDWDRMYRLLERYPLPKATVVHSVYRQTANP